MRKEDFCQLVARYEKLVYSVCFQLCRNHHTAQDLAQETFLSAYTHLDSCPADNPKAWLARIAANKAKDHLKSAYSRKVYATEDGALAPDAKALFAAEHRPDEEVERRELQHALAGAVSTLSEPYHRVASLYFLADQSVGQIADALCRPKKTVQTQVCRARQKLAVQLQGVLSPAC